MSMQKQIDDMAKVIAIPCYKRIEVYGDGSKECPSPLPCNECTAELLYNAGYRKQEWISVEERLPTLEDGKVLIYTPYGISIAQKTTTNHWKGENAIPKLITHWMPLPSPPEKEKNND